MATPPTTLIPPGAGGPVLIDFCECACGILGTLLYVSQRAATAGPAYDGPSDPDRKPGENTYSVAQGRLAAQPYPDFASTDFISGSGLPRPFVVSSTQTSWEITTGNAPSTTTQSISTDTDPHADSLGYPQASASLLQGRYKLRINFPAPWQGDSTLSVHWRERTVHYSLLYIYGGGPGGSETGSITYTSLSETLTPTAGAMYVETSIHTPNANLGDEVSVTGPAEIGAYFARQMQSLSDGGATACGILVTAFAAAAQKCGFLPYIRSHADATSDEDAQPQDIYASETASTAPGFTIQYSGAQAIQDSDQITTSPPSVSPVNTFSDNVPPTSISQYDGSGTASPSTVGAAEVTPTILQWSSAVAAGLVLTLGDAILTSALQDFVQGLLAAAPSPMPGDASGLLTLYHLPADELSYSVKQATQQAYLNIVVDAGIESQSPANQGTPSNPYGTVLALLTGAEVDITVDLLTTDLDTGTQADSQLSFSFTINTTTPGIQYFTLTQAQTAVPLPTTNQKVTWSNPQVITTTMERWSAPPQVTVNDASE